MTVVRAELVKLRTTAAGWWLAGAALLLAVPALFFNSMDAGLYSKPFDDYLVSSGNRGATGQALDNLRGAWQTNHPLPVEAAHVYTSGQHFGVLLMCLVGILAVTSEFRHQTVTGTLLATPRRTTVIVTKAVAAMLVAAGMWLVITAVSIGVGATYLQHLGRGTGLGRADVQRAIGLNLASYTVWALLGVGLGALIRNQVVAAVAACVAYLIGTPLAQGIISLLHQYVLHHDWVLTAQVAVPAVASNVMLSPAPAFHHAPAAWVGAAVLIGYAVLTGALGIRTLAHRDIT
jgi:hypothetical protein